MGQDKLMEAKKNFVDLEFGDKKCFLSKDADIDWAIGKAYDDMQVRTIKGHCKEVKEASCDCLAKEIKEYFKNDFPNNQDDYDKRYEKMCDAFLNSLNNSLNGKQENGQKFGKAQKVVNMTFKYLYCFEDAEEKKDWFKFCHMPIDSYVLNWYKSLPVLKEEERRDIVWSNLEKDEYSKIKSEIIEYLKSENAEYNSDSLPKIPLQADFIIWQEEKRKVMLKELQSHLRRCRKDKYFLSKLSDSEKRAVEEAANTILKDEG